MWRILLCSFIICTFLTTSVLATFASFNSNSAVIVSSNVWNGTVHSIEVDSLSPGQQYRVYATQSAQNSAGEYVGNVVITGADGTHFDVQSLAKPIPNTGYVLAETNILTAPITIADTTEPAKNVKLVPFVIYIVSTKISASPVISALLAGSHVDSSITKVGFLGELTVSTAGYDSFSQDYTVLSVNKYQTGSKLTVEGPIVTLNNPAASPANFTFDLSFDAAPHGHLAPGAMTVFLSQGWLSEQASYDSDYPLDTAQFSRCVEFGRPVRVKYRSLNNLASATACSLLCIDDFSGQQLLFSCTLDGIIFVLEPPCTSINLTVDKALINGAPPRFMVQIETIDFLALQTTTERTPMSKPADPYCNCAVDKQWAPDGWRYNDIWLDIVIIVDASEAMDEEPLANAIYLVDTLISDGYSDFLITDTTNPFSTRIAVIEMTDTAKVLYNLNMTKADKVQGKIATKKGVRQINVINAFNAAMAMFNGASTPDRANTRQIVFYLTDTEPKQDLTPLNQFKQSKGVIIVNSGLQSSSLLSLASKGYYFLNLNNKHALRAFCKANCFCKPGKQAYGGSDPAITAGGGCYSSYPKGFSFSNAQTTCASEGGIIAVDHDGKKGEFLNRVLIDSSSKSDYFWIGFSKSDDGSWKREDKSIDSYTNWNVGEPNSATVSKCVYVDTTSSNLAWGAGNCNVAFPFVCEDLPCSVGYKNC